MTITRFSGLELNFLQDRYGTGGGVGLFTPAAQPKTGMPNPHRRVLARVLGC